MMRENLERYFPVCRPFFHRVKRWTQICSYWRSKVDSSGPVPVVCHTLETDNASAAGRTLVFLSDLHWFGRKRDAALKKKVCRQLEKISPDYLILGGDQSGDAEQLNSLFQVLGEFASLAKVTFAVNGNWESGKHWITREKWQELYNRCGVNYLCNSLWSDGVVTFAGVDDVSRGLSQLPELPGNDNTLKILLAHSPDTVVALDHKMALKEFSLALCGHTHGGQIRLPFIGPLCTRSRYFHSLVYGRFAHKRIPLQMIVSSGISQGSFPLRFNCRREMVKVELVYNPVGKSAN